MDGRLTGHRRKPMECRISLEASEPHGRMIARQTANACAQGVDRLEKINEMP
jgi:hypothetical protein